MKLSCEIALYSNKAGVTIIHRGGGRKKKSGNVFQMPCGDKLSDEAVKPASTGQNVARK